MLEGPVEHVRGAAETMHVDNGPTSAGRRLFRCRRRVSSTGRGAPAPIIGSARKTAKIACGGLFAAAAWHGSSSLP